MPISKDLLDILVCPLCKATVELKPDQSGLKCVQCKRVYPIRDDIPGDADRRSENRRISGPLLRMGNVFERLAPSARVAVIRLRSLGDCVLTTPAISLLKQARPDLRIAVVVEAGLHSHF